MIGEFNNFNADASVVLDANGYGVLQFRPSNANWQITTCNVSTTSALPTIARTYIGTPIRANVKDITSEGNGDTTDTVYNVPDGNPFTVEWVGGTPGSTAYATITGQATVKGGGFRVAPVA